jgi:type IV pilus assembly protein PilA
MNCIIRRPMMAILLTVAIVPAVALSSEKETPSSVDIQRHTTAIGSALAQAAGVQQIVVAYHQRTNNFPASNADAGVKPAASLVSPDVRSIEVASGGVVVVTLTATSGTDGGTITFTPTVSNGDENLVEWTCRSSSFSTISDDTGGVCEYSKLP